MPILSDWNITHDGVTYPRGEVIFVLPENVENELIESGIAERVPVAPAAEGSPPSGGPGGDNGDKDPNAGGGADDVLSPEEFGKLTAPEQKAELELVGIEPASNAPDRLAQYKEWYEQSDDAE